MGRTMGKLEIISCVVNLTFIFFLLTFFLHDFLCCQPHLYPFLLTLFSTRFCCSVTHSILGAIFPSPSTVFFIILMHILHKRVFVSIIVKYSLFSIEKIYTRIVYSSLHWFTSMFVMLLLLFLYSHFCFLSLIAFTHH